MTNIYHRYLKLPFEYPKPDTHFIKVKDYTASLHPKYVYSKFIDWASSYNCKLSNVVELFYTAPGGGKIQIHNDTGILPGKADVAKINFTWGSTDSFLKWWQVSDQSKIIKIYHDAGSAANESISDNNIVPDIQIQAGLIALESDATLIYQAVIDRPSLINAGQFHSTFNPSPDMGRWTLSFVPLTLDGNILLFSQALEIFKDCIE
jgi:hypothetical protein